MKYLKSDPFNSMPSNDNYRDNYDKVFGKKCKCKGKKIACKNEKCQCGKEQK